MACEIEPVDHIAVRRVRIVAVRSVPGVAVRMIVIRHAAALRRAGLQLLDLRARVGKVAARGAQLGVQHEHRDKQHDRESQK